jgi:serine/threonine protein kinase
MAQLIEPPGGEGPVDDWERRVVAKLVRELPDAYTIIPNLLVTNATGQRFEYDVVVVAPHAVYVVEVKGWRGRIRGDRWEWLLNGRRRPNPMLLTERKAKVLKSELVTHAQALGRVRVEAVVVLANEQAMLDLTGEGRRMVAKLCELVGLLSDPEQVRQTPDAIARLTPTIRTAILRRTTGRTRVLRFRDYEVLETLAQSDEGTTYRARRVDMPAAPEVRLRVVTLSPYLLDERERAQQEDRLFREVEALLRMGAHPNVVTARDVFRDDNGRIVVVQESDDARSLRQRLAGGTPLTVEERLGVLADICRGLAHAHAHGVIHRLVTPGHVLLGDDGQARLADFGLAKLEANGSSTVWQADAVEPPDQPYLAPELRNPALGPPEATTDLYGVGLIAWELFAGAGAPRPASAAAPPPGMPAELAELVERLLQEHPAARVASAAEVLSLLERLRGSGAPPSTGGPKQVYDTGDLINNEFEVRAQLGRGGFRSVYRVYRALNDCEFALKVFNSGGFSAVQREISILEGIEHPNVERVVWAGQTGQGQWYLVAGLLDGETLAEYAGGDKHLAVEEVLAVGDQLLAALEAIHPNQRRIDVLTAAGRERSLSAEEAEELMALRSTGIVHRDVKPQNLLLTQDGVVLIDFNIASHAGDPAETLSGTPAYTPPDAGLRGWDPSVDLFGAGVTLYELICGAHPYDGVPSGARQPIDPRTFRSDLSPELAAFLVKACAPLAEERFATAAEMREALAAIDAPLRPAPAWDTGGIPRRLADLLAAAPPNVNPMVTEFLGLSSQARRSNRETRGLSELAASTYVDTRLDRELTEAVLAGRHRLVIITGNAGDGKTAFIQRVEALAQQRGAAFQAHGPNGSILQLGSLLLHTLYDGSQDEDDRTSDEVLREFLAPFAIDGGDDGAVRLAAINEGRLRDFVGTHRDRFAGLVDLLAELDEPGSRTGDAIMLVNLNLRSVTAGSADSIFSRQVQAIVGGPFWEPCQTCDHRARCPIKHNVDTFADPVSGGEVTERLRRLVDVVRLRRRRHLTMRDVRSLISHVLFRDRDCHEVAELLASDDPLIVADVAYFQASGGLGVPPETMLERGAELLAEADVAAVASPSDDRTLATGRTPPRMGFPRRESDYPYELVARAYEDAGTGVEADVDLVRRAHAALRRLTFFERRDDRWLDMLPYRQLRELERALAADGTGIRAELLGRVVQALSAAQGMGAAPNGGGALWLAAGGGPSGVRGFRRFAATEFQLHVAVRNLPYVEAEPDRLDLVHVPSGTVLPVDLDVLELLERLRQGYVPSVDEGRGLLVHLQLFFNRLRALASSELLLVTEQGLRRIAARPGGVVELSEVGS